MFYFLVTLAISPGEGNEGKVMGLAPHGVPASFTFSEGGRSDRACSVSPFDSGRQGDLSRQRWADRPTVCCKVRAARVSFNGRT